MKHLIILFSGLILSCGIFARSAPFKRTIKPVDERPVQRSDRPHFDYSAVTVDQIQPGVIRVKLIGGLTEYLDTAIFKTNPDGVRLFGIPQLDRLNEKYKVSGIRQTFFISMNEKQFDRCHRKWELNLWYDLFVPVGTDTKQMALDYAELGEVSHSEPAFILKMEDPGEYRIVDPTGKIHGRMDFYPNDPKFGEQWALNNTGQAGGTPGSDIHAPAAWDLCTGDPDVIIAVMDQGVDYHHEDLYSNMWPGIGYNFVHNNDTITPQYHGTLVAGIIAGVTNNGKGISGVAGGNGTGNGVRLMACEVGENGGFSPGVVDSYIWAADHGAAISNNSWGITSGNLFGFALLDAIDYFIVNGGGSVMEGGIVICASGNGSSLEFFPASFCNSLGVAATNNKDIRAYYSNYQDWIDLSAPGGEVPPDEAGILSTLPGNQYGSDNGTSLACPQVAGVAGLVVSYAKGQLTAQDLRDILVNSTDNIDQLNPGFIGKLGSGRVNAFKALQLAQSYIHPGSITPPEDLTAQAVSDAQINLNWQPDADNDSVLLAFNFTNNFGHPEGIYFPGEAIDGGGIILYSGKGTGFNHTLLNSGTVHYYSIWSKKNNSYSYSTRRSQDTTFCGPATVLPCLQNFDMAPYIPQCWTDSNPAYPWQYIWGDNENHPPAPHSGQYNACFFTGTGNGKTNKLVTGMFDLGGYSMVQLSFWHTQEKRGTGQDELRIHYRNSTGGPWILLKTYTQNISAWVKDSVQLPGLSSSYQLAFEGTEHFGYGVCLDDIELTDVAPPVLSVTPGNRDVPPDEGSTDFLVNTNKYWTTTSDADWCRTEYTGNGIDTMDVHYLTNPDAITRVAHISISVPGLNPVTVTVTQSGIVGTNNIIEENDLSVWPDPFKDESILSIRGKDLCDPEIILTGMNGRMILQKNLEGLNEFRLKLPTIAAGYYILIIKSDRRVYVKPLIKVQ